MKRQRPSNGTREVLRLNVGGRLFHTTPETQSRSPFFAALLGNSFGVDRDEDGNIFIDRGGLSFPGARM